MKISDLFALMVSLPPEFKILIRRYRYLVVVEKETYILFYCLDFLDWFDKISNTLRIVQNFHTETLS